MTFERLGSAVVITLLLLVGFGLGRLSLETELDETFQEGYDACEEDIETRTLWEVGA